MPNATATHPPVDLDDVFGALGSPTRRSIVRRLAGGDATVSELAAPFEMSLPAVSKHIGILEQAGLVRRWRDGRSRRCALNAEVLSDAERWIASCRRYWEDTLDSLAEYVEGQDPVR